MSVVRKIAIVAVVLAHSVASAAHAVDARCSRILYKALPEAGQGAAKDFFLIATLTGVVKVEAGDLVFAASTSCERSEDAVCLESVPFSIRIPKNPHVDSSWELSGVTYRVTAKIKDSAILGRRFAELLVIERRPRGAADKVEVLSFAPMEGLLTFSTWNKRVFVLEGLLGLGSGRCAAVK